MRVLITNNTLASRAGSELYALDVARRLKELGHEVAAYSPRLGLVAEEFRQLGIPVVAELSGLPFVPDIIHGQHHAQTMKALTSLPDTPAVYFCHGALPPEEMPPVFPRILRYVAVDELCRERVMREAKPPESRVRVLLNFVDLERFAPRAALPGRPRRALLFSNYANNRNFSRIVRRSCDRLGIELDVVGGGAGNATRFPEKILPGYDLVFAKARAAIEAMAVGNAVVICDRPGCGPMVDVGNFDQLRPLNFGFRTMTREITVANLTEQIERYDAQQAAAVCRTLREQADLKGAVDEIVRIYEEVVSEYRQYRPDRLAELRATNDYALAVQGQRRPGGFLRRFRFRPCS